LQTEDDKLVEERGTNVNKLVVFNDNFVEFQKLLKRACLFCKLFFEEIEEKTPDMLKLYYFGQRLMKLKQVVKAKYDQLCSILPNNLATMRLYSSFLEVVLNESAAASEVIEK
jgi:hypothetical protein